MSLVWRRNMLLIQSDYIHVFDFDIAETATSARSFQISVSNLPQSAGGAALLTLFFNSSDSNGYFCDVFCTG